MVALLLLAALASAARADEVISTQRAISDMIPLRRITISTATASANNWAVLPEAGYSPDQSVNAGFKFTGRNLGDSHLTLDSEFNAALGHQRIGNASFLAPDLLDRQALNLDEYRYYLSPDQRFFGLGNNHVRSPEAYYSIERQRALATFAWHLRRNFLIALSGGARRTAIGPAGASSGGPSVTKLFPQLTGIGGGHTNPISASFIYNQRDSITRPTKGWSVIGAIEHVNQNLGNDFHFTRYTLEAGYLHPLWSPDRIFGLHASGEFLGGPSRNIPFFELASLGGGDDMRGFFPGRFLGRSRLLINSEFRDKLTEFNFRHIWDVQIDGVLFADAGRVYLSNNEISSEFHSVSSAVPGLFEEFRYSCGTGVRIALGEAILARIDVGFSNEQTGLVYLVFGHTF